MTVGEVEGFQYLNFYLPTTQGAGGKMLIVTYYAYLSENTDGTGRWARGNVGIDSASTPLKAGDKVILIDASAGTLTSTPASTTAGVLGVTLNEQTKSLSEVYLAGLALVNQGNELIGWQGMQEAAIGRGLFGKIAGGSLKYDTGSYIEMPSVSLMSSFEWNVNRFTLGAFFEYGNGCYDTHNSFRTSASIDSSGDTDYMGLGIAAKFRLTDRVYLDAALRAVRDGRASQIRRHEFHPPAPGRTLQPHND